jgi:predicted TIM-barrel fold metal-dependent hydrolase
MILDAHAHLYHPSWYPAAFSQSIASDYARRSGASGRQVLTSTAETLVSRMLTDSTGTTTLKIMDKVGINKRVILILDWGVTLGEAEKSIWEIHREILGICGRFPDRLVGFAGVDPRRTDASALLKSAFDDLGARGLKLHPTSRWRLDDPETHRVVEIAAHRHLPVLIHIGRTLDCLSDVNAQPQALVDLAKAFPGVTFIAGHSGFEGWDAFVSNPEVPRNVYFDISGWQELLSRNPAGMKIALSSLLKAFPGRVCFGSDSPFFSYNLITSEASWLKSIVEYEREAVGQALSSTLLHNSLVKQLWS